VNDILSFVLKSAQPRHFGPQAEPMEGPTFLLDSESWDQAVALAEKNEVLLPFLVGTQQADWKSEIPKAVRESLDQRMKNELITLAVLENEFENILSQMVTSRLQVILLAGSILQRDLGVEQLFCSSRQLDLLIGREQLHPALRIAGKLGYRIVQENRGGVALKRSLQSSSSGMPVESYVRIRWRILESDAEHEAAAVWESAVPRVSPEFPTGLKALSAEDKLVQLVRHGLIERRLKSPGVLNELDYWIRSRKDLDWQKALFLLERARAQAPAALAFRLLTRYWGAVLPPDTAQALAQNIGVLRRRALMQWGDWKHWFAERPNALLFRFDSELLLHDHTTEAVKAAFGQKTNPEVA
jgi:hypothetical protein